MTAEERELWRIVELVVGRVKERLVREGQSPGPAMAQGESCDRCERTAAECAGCGYSVRRRPEDALKIISLGAVRLSAKSGIGHVRADLAPYIDHTLLKPDATRDDLRRLCEEAARFGFASVCVNSANVRFCKTLLQGKNVMVVAVVGFPLGASSPEAKAFEAREAVRNGADEIDMVMNIGALKSKDYALVLEDIRKVVKAVAPKKVKVIIETGMLSHNEKVVACALAKVGGAAFVKTSTGFGPGGATAQDVALMKEVVGEEVEVKASGGIRTPEAAQQMIEAGATRIGASASVAIVTGKGKGGRRAAGY